ncbi:MULTISPECIES: hypothetical protein [Mycobacteroides]|uniref:hypothetical protein n=1 Tax=Mycobacteroides TaxID=670516 RepID=UPI001041E8D9|nr:hypothetical protein [Mycobacteroides abscessus]
MVGRYWRAIEWDFQHLLGVNALDYFAAPCRCAQCRTGDTDYVSRRDWDQFIRFYETCNARRGSYCQSAALTDPVVIDLQASAPESDWEPGPPPLFGWSAEIDALTNIADQLIASRSAGSKDVKYYPRPVIPAEKERKKRKANKQDNGLEAALERGRKAAALNYQ